MGIELGIASAASFLIGWCVSENYNRKKLINYVKDRMADEAAEHDAAERLAIRVEKIDGELFAYRADDDVFLIKSKTGLELVNQLEEMYNDRKVNIVIHKDDGAEYIQEFF